MMRKIFGGAMAFSLVGAVLLGGVLAWQTSETVSGDNAVGKPGIDATANHNGTLLGPDGYAVQVATIDVSNTGDYRLQASSPYGFVQILGVSVPPAQQACGNQNFEGAGTQLKLANPLYLDPLDLNETVDDAVSVNIETIAGAPASCQGATVSWAATVVLTTIGG
ncbi:MAG: hypothetical protein HYX53_14535 [Chloroflexi bacterium]|nr:hypothetical protein [Chloroflexota bacterium]